MYRCTPTASTIYCAPCDLREERDVEAVEDLVEGAELVILVDDLDDIKEMYPNTNVQVV